MNKRVMIHTSAVLLVILLAVSRVVNYALVSNQEFWHVTTIENNLLDLGIIIAGIYSLYLMGKNLNTKQMLKNLRGGL